jgi:signal transduction histidine kinase
MFHIQSGVVAVLLTIDRAAVQEAMTNQLRQNERLRQFLVGPDLLRQENGAVLHRAGTLPESPPDVLMSISSRFGGWQLASWDARESRVTYHLPILASGMALGVLIVLGGLSMDAQQRRAAKLAAQRVSFVNRVSHELRTPMTNILLNLDVIEESLPEASQDRFGLIREEAGRLSRLIENVLTFSQKEEGCLKLQKAPHRPVEVVEGIVRQFEPALARRGILLTHTHEGSRDEIVLDADALAQITANLLSNVEKYAPNAPASLRTLQNEHEFTLTLHDGGPGISEKDAKRVFEPFERLDDRVSAGVSGAGLGLSIAKELAQRMGGSLLLHEVEKGACFAFKLPSTS